MRARLGALAVALLTVACSGTGSQDADRPQVVAAFYPLAFVASEVAGGAADVTNLSPPGVEPHDLELTPGQVRSLAEADLVVHLGGGFQPTVEDAIADLDGDVVE